MNRKTIGLGIPILFLLFLFAGGFLFRKTELEHLPGQEMELDHLDYEEGSFSGQNANLRRPLLVPNDESGEYEPNVHKRSKSGVFILSSMNQKPLFGSHWKIQPLDPKVAPMTWNYSQEQAFVELVPGKYNFHCLNMAIRVHNPVSVSLGVQSPVWGFPELDLELNVQTPSGNPVPGATVIFKWSSEIWVDMLIDGPFQADEDGRVEISSSGGGESGWLYVWKPGYEGVKREIKLSGQDDLGVTLAPIEGRNALSVTVLDAESKAPIQGAKVHLAGYPMFRSFCDSVGVAKLPYFSGKSYYEVAAPDYTGQTFSISQGKEREIFLRKESELSLEIAGDFEYPIFLSIQEIEEGKDSVPFQGSSSSGWIYQETIHGVEPIRVSVPEGVWLRVMVTAGDGNQCSENIAPIFGSRKIQLSLPGSHIQPLRIQLIGESGGPVKGSITTSNSSHQDVQAIVRNLGAGLFELRRFQDLRWLRISSPGYANAMLRRIRRTPPQGGVLNLRLHPEVEMKGMIVDERGQPYAGIQITLGPKATGNLNSTSILPGWELIDCCGAAGGQAVSFLDGKFSIPGLSSGTYLIELRPSFSEDHPPKGGRVLYEITLPLEGSTVLECPRFRLLKVFAWDAQSRQAVDGISVTSPRDPMGVREIPGALWQGWVLQDSLDRLTVRAKGFQPAKLNGSGESDGVIQEMVYLERSATSEIKFVGPDANQLIGGSLQFTQGERKGDDIHWFGWTDTFQINAGSIHLSLPFESETLAVRRVKSATGSNLSLEPQLFTWTPGATLEFTVIAK
ncbi:MAG: hypothetical protein DWQ01_12330 [Planctomycetota bacterium]|nr:MAG: hypothetical protein DWQ01_12330 [Planctomycetota bacterium]